jgi:hypothetical protein
MRVLKDRRGMSRFSPPLPVGEGKKMVVGTVPGGWDFYYTTVFKAGVSTARAFSVPIWMDNQ